MDEKKPPRLGSVENCRSDTFTAPSFMFPTRLDVEYRETRIIAGKNGQLTGAAVKLIGQITQANAAGGDVVNLSYCAKTAISDLNRNVFEMNARLASLVSVYRSRHGLIQCRSGISERKE